MMEKNGKCHGEWKTWSLVGSFQRCCIRPLIAITWWTEVQKKKNRQKAQVWESAPYGETDGILCSYEISSIMHFSWVFNSRWCTSLNVRCIKPTERRGSKPLHVPNKTLSAAVTSGTSQLESVDQRKEKQMQHLPSRSNAPQMQSR